MSVIDLLTIIYFIVFLSILLFLKKAAILYFNLYKKKKKPNFPLNPKETLHLLSKNPDKFIKTLPLIPIKMWSIIFEKHNDKELNNAAKTVHYYILIFICATFLFLGAFFLLAYLNKVN